MGDIAQQVTAFVAVIGVPILWWQIHRANLQSRTKFEDDLAREYRELTRHMPTEVFLNKELSEEKQAETLPFFYRYIDLSNEQTFLRMNKRVSKKTWDFWRDGIRSNLERPAFKEAWSKIKCEAPKSFEELQRLEKSNFEEDPLKWKQ